MTASIEPSLQNALTAVERFAKDLECLEKAPQCITIARSVYSGYTPATWAAEIESALLSELARIYNISLKHWR